MGRQVEIAMIYIQIRITNGFLGANTFKIEEVVVLLLLLLVAYILYTLSAYGIIRGFGSDRLLNVMSKIYSWAE